MPSSSVLGAAGAAENTDLFETGWIRFSTGSTDVGDRNCDDSESIRESILFDSSTEPSDDNTSASSDAAARAGEGGSQRRIVASAPAGREPAASGGRPDAAGSFRVGGYVATAEALEALDPWVGLEQYNIDRLMGA